MDGIFVVASAVSVAGLLLAISLIDIVKKIDDVISELKRFNDREDSK